MTRISTAAPTFRPGVDELNRSIHAYGESIRSFFREQQRSSLVSPLFNIPGRMVLGGYCYYENLPALLRLITAVETPEQIGQRMKSLCCLPNYISLNSLMIGYFNGREQARLKGTARSDNIEEIGAVVDFWSRAAAAYRNDGKLLPDEAGFTVPILSAGQVKDLAVRLRDDVTDEIRHRLRRMMATLELYTFVLNGESRIGVFHHGPYPLENGDVLVVKELVGLQEDFYSWATPDVRLPCAGIARVMRLRNTQVRIVLMGSMTTEPRSLEDNIVADGLFYVEHGEAHLLPDAELAALTERAADAQLTLYRRMSEWDARYRVAYGWELYGRILHSFAPPNRQEEFRDAIRKSFRATVEQRLDDLVSGKETPLVLTHIAKTDGPVYAPIAN